MHNGDDNTMSVTFSSDRKLLNDNQVRDEVQYNKLFFEEESKRDFKTLKKQFLDTADNAPESSPNMLVFPWSIDNKEFRKDGVKSKYKPERIPEKEILEFLKRIEQIHCYDPLKIRTVSKKKLHVCVAIISAISLVGLGSIPLMLYKMYTFGIIM